MNTLIRLLRPSERSLLEEFCYQAIFLPEGVAPLPREIVRTPEIWNYIARFGTRKDDHCLVAETDGRVVGAVWVRVLAGDEPGSIRGYGNVDAETPEFAISVLPEYRNRGIGTRLMAEMIDYLRACGYKQTSLSVQKANYAASMYRKLGFETVGENEEDFIMVLKFAES
ncbi:MAG: GNAT family N-acetyltransferase [Dysgonamonadaceae bacterium]|nr:GNAT family N-acetyltransferase [Dysgonamonadaceae bacterium]